jgi:hypothetical protein
MTRKLGKIGGRNRKSKNRTLAYLTSFDIVVDLTDSIFSRDWISLSALID